MEFIDILDENGIPTGETATRKEVHKKGLWHRAVLICIINASNKILIQQRASNKEKYPNLWDISVAGHVPSGMDSLNAVYTEVMEEIGTQIPFKIKVEDFRFLTSFRDSRIISDDFIENQFYDLFVLKLNTKLENLSLQLEEVQDIAYKSPFQIKEMVEDGKMHPRTQWVDFVYRYLAKKF